VVRPIKIFGPSAGGVTCPGAWECGYRTAIPTPVRWHFGRAGAVRRAARLL